MEYNIDILVAGCNTTCMHCYVDGGYAPAMSLSNFYLCMEKLRPAFDNLKDRISFTLDNELFNHPNAVDILECVRQDYRNNYFHHGSTTGIAFLNHPKQAELLEILGCNKWDSVSFALHGNHDTHNSIVNNSHGLESLIEAGKVFKEHNFKVWISLMISKKLVKELDDLSKILSQIPYDNILPVIPDYYPTPRLMKYQIIRCNKGDFDELFDFLIDRNVDICDIEKAVQLYNEESILNDLDCALVAEELTSKSTAFFHIDNNLEFYLGNTGSAIKHLGNIKNLTSEEIYQLIASSEDNYYETGKVHYRDILTAISNDELKPSKENYVYPSRISGIIAMIGEYNLQGGIL